MFYVCDKQERANFLLLRLEILRKDEHGSFVVLWAYPTEDMDVNGEGKPFGTVHPARFINRFDLIKVIAVPTQEQEQEGS